MTSFVPVGWTIVDSTKGDLNGDTELDMAFVIKSKDSLITYSFNEFEGEQRVNRMEIQKYPRTILIIVVKDPINESFNLIEQSNSIIIGSNTKIEIDKSDLKIEYNLFDEGQNFRGNHKYYFSYKNKQLLLTSADGFKTDGLWITHYVFDFIGQKWGLTRSKVNVGDPATIWKSLDNIEPKSMKEFERPFIWHITEDIYL